MDLSVGVTPKSVQVDVVTLDGFDLATVDVNDVSDDVVETDLGSFTTLLKI